MIKNDDVNFPVVHIPSNKKPDTYQHRMVQLVVVFEIKHLSI